MAWSAKPRKGDAIRCSATTKSGTACQAYAVVATYDSPDGPRCVTHSKTPEQITAHARKMAKRVHLNRKAAVEPAPSIDLTPGISFGDVMRIVAPALEATFPNGSPDYDARLCAAGVVVISFPRYMRETPEAVQALLQEALPPRVLDPERVKADAIYAGLRASWDRLEGLGWSELHGVVTKPYPPGMIAVYEDAAKIQRSRPAPVSPDDPRVLRLPNGTVALERDGELPVMVEPLSAEEEADYENAVPAW